jgi:opacity protein-like surface antigen
MIGRKGYFTKLLITVLACLFTQAVFSSTMNSAPSPFLTIPSGVVVSLSAGPVWQSNGQSQTFYLAPGLEKTYKAANSTHYSPAGELFVGLQKSLSSLWLGQLGLALAANGDTTLNGNIWDDADPQFNNYTYQYNVQSTQISVKGKLIMDMGYWLMPWISASAGVGFNHAHDFSNSPVIFEAVPNSNFKGNTLTVFTYSLALGVQKAFDRHWVAGVGYQFSDWGKSQLARAANQPLNSGLNLDHLYSSGVMFNLTYSA